MEATSIPNGGDCLETKAHSKLSLVYLGAHLDSPSSFQPQELPNETRSESPDSYEPDRSEPKWREPEYSEEYNFSFVYMDHCLETFHRFRDLPTEVRCMIWEMVLPGQRFFGAHLTLFPDMDNPEKMHPRDDALKEVRLVLFQGKGRLDPPVLSTICQESRCVLQQHAKLVFSTGTRNPGLWWMPETDVLGFCQEYFPEKEVGRLQDLQGLEHIQHVFLDFEYSLCALFEVGVDPNPINNKQPCNHAEIQMLRLCLPELMGPDRIRWHWPHLDDPRKRNFSYWPIFYPEYFPGMRLLTIHETGYDFQYYCSFGNLCDSASFCNGCTTFHVGRVTTDEASLYGMEHKLIDEPWDDPMVLDPIYKHRPGPILAIREGFSGTADQLQWRRW